MRFKLLARAERRDRALGGPVPGSRGASARPDRLNTGLPPHLEEDVRLVGALAELFATVAAEGSFSQAARKLFISQPSVSYQVRELERYGLLNGKSVAGTAYYDEEASVVAGLASEFLRFGVEARLPDATGSLRPVSELLTDALVLARAHARELDCEEQLDGLPALLAVGGGAGRQRAAYSIAGMDGLLRELTGLTGAVPPPAPSHGRS